jgi:hypothetical protein
MSCELPLDKFDEIISEPLLTDEGFVNELALRQLDIAINNIPPTYERLAGEPEWNVPRWVFLDNITGAFAKWAVRQSPYGCPENLESVIRYLAACLARDVPWDAMGMAKLSLCDINLLLHNILLDKGVTYFDAWNVPKKGKHETRFFSVMDGPGDPDYDFIDLYALLHNVCLDIRTERRAADDFDKRFEEENGREL